MKKLFLTALFGTGMIGNCSENSTGNNGSNRQFESMRDRMVREQLAAPGRGISDQRVLKVMGKVPRHQFVPAKLRSRAYGDGPLPIGQNQTISQPYIVAFMTEILEPETTDRVLEIGTGSGYQAAVLAELVKHVYTIEIIPELAVSSRKTLLEQGYKNVAVRSGDGYLGWPEQAPFDAIIVTCAPDDIPQPLVEQLAEGGRMVIPVGPAHNQNIHLIEKHDGQLTTKKILPVRFVPMTGIAEEKD